MLSRSFAAKNELHGCVFVDRTLEETQVVQSFLQFYVYWSRACVAQQIDKLHWAGVYRHFSRVIVFVVDNPFGFIG